MKNSRFGFTLVEVSLFLAVTGLLFVGLTVGMRASILQQRQNDSVQNFMEFLRTAYSETTNVEHTGNGRSELAVYGKLLVFGENVNFAGENLDGKGIFSYTVVGEVGDIGSGNVLSALTSANANVLIKKDDAPYALAGIAEEYNPKWGASIQSTKAYSKGKYEPFSGSVLIVRHPRSGTISTFFYDEAIQINSSLVSNPMNSNLANILKDRLSSFVRSDVDFCINTNGEDKTNLRRDIRIVAGAKNALGIELVADSPEYDTAGNNIGNRCE